MDDAVDVVLGETDLGSRLDVAKNAHFNCEFFWKDSVELV